MRKKHFLPKGDKVGRVLGVEAFFWLDFIIVTQVVFGTD